MSNEYLKYTSRDYNSIYSDLVSAIPGMTDLWTNTSDSDPGIVLVKLMSALGDMISYNMDKQALEYYSSTVTQRKNASKLFNLIGYKMHWYKSATTKISVTNTIVIPNNLKAVRAYQEFIEYCKDNNLNDDSLNLSEEDASKEIDNNTIKGKALKLRNSYMSLSEYFFKNRPPQKNRDLYIEKEENGNTEYIPNYKLVLGEGDLYDEYTQWWSNNTLNLYTYIGSINKTLSVRNNNRTDISYIIKPTIATNISGENILLRPTDSIEPGSTKTFDVIQGNLQSVKFNSSRLRNNRYYFYESAIDEDNIWLSYIGTVNNNSTESQIFIERVDNLLTTTDDTLHFEFGIDDFDIPYIELSNYWATILGDSVDFTLYYVSTNGVYGNITKNYLNTIENLSGNYTITHPSNNSPYIDEQGNVIATSGRHPETATQAYKESQNYVTTFNSLVTIYDFERFCKRQIGITNAFAVDGQRSDDLNSDLEKLCNSMSLAQLQSFFDESNSNDKDNSKRNDVEYLHDFYISRKKVNYNDIDPSIDYKKYGLSLHIVYGNFATTMQDVSKIANIDTGIVGNEKRGYWTYCIISNQNDNYIHSDNYKKTKINYTNYDSIEDVNATSGNIAIYLDEKFRTTRIVTVVPEYMPIRVFPWRCCGTIHLKNPVTSSVANNILETVMSHLSVAFHPGNIEFGKKISYMDIINVVTDSHEMIRYFDAGLGNRKLIDIDESVDFTYFNAVSLMYYVQTQEGFNINGNMRLYGNTEPKTKDGSANPYYKLLSIAPEYIVD